MSQEARGHLDGGRTEPEPQHTWSASANRYRRQGVTRGLASVPNGRLEIGGRGSGYNAKFRLFVGPYWTMGSGHGLLFRHLRGTWTHNAISCIW